MCNNTKIYHENLTIMCFCTLFDIPLGRGTVYQWGCWCMRFAVREVLGGRRVLMFCQAATCWCLALSMGRNAGGRVTNAKIQKERAFCKKKREFLPTILRSENFALKVAKPFVSGHFRQEKKRSEIDRKIFEKMLIILMKGIWNTLIVKRF